jgi:hypothetical protein
VSQQDNMTKFPAQPASMPGVNKPVPPEDLLFAAMFDPKPADPGAPRRLNFILGVSLSEMNASQIYHVLGELRSQIRKSVVAQGNTALGDSL